jgi:hypothetical protein
MLKAKHFGLLGLLVVAGVLALILFIFFPSLPDPKCAALLARPESDVDISIPANCIQTTDVPSDDMVKYLEDERNTRGLIFKKWITCETPNQTPTPGFASSENHVGCPVMCPVPTSSGARSSSSPTYSPFPKDLLSWPKYA